MESDELTMRKVTGGFVLPLAMYIGLSYVVPTHDVFVALLAPMAIGFVLLTEGCRWRTRLLIAVGYFPWMLGIQLYFTLIMPLAAYGLIGV